jgi:hypothetical protein
MVSVHTGNLLSVAEPSQPTESSIAEIYRIAAPSVMYRGFRATQMFAATTRQLAAGSRQ